MEPKRYAGVDAETRGALAMGRDQLRAALADRAEIFGGSDDMVAAMAAHMLADYRAALAAGEARVAMIVPVGPIGQYQRLAAACLDQGQPLDRLTLIVMDEYLTDAGHWIDQSDPLSFRAHIRRNLTEALPRDMRPGVVVPDPADPGAVERAIADAGGVDVTYAGVGITGHLAFNEPMQDVVDADYFASLGTRVVALMPETRLINSVTAVRGNTLRIPRLAVTVGMREILAACKLRLYLNRDWQCAALRRLAFGPVTAAFPASLAQRHPDWSLHLVDKVLDEPEPLLA